MKNRFNWCYFLISPVIIVSLITIFYGCNTELTQKSEKVTLFKILPPTDTGVHFNNKISESPELNIVTYEMLYNGAGVGVGDLNNDGLIDVFLASNMGESKLYLNEGDFQFRDITDMSGIQTSGKWASGVTIVDINNDGFLDIYVSFGGPYAYPERRSNELYINNGDSTFTELAQEYNIADTGFTTHAAFFDYNKDGLLDLYLLTNAQGKVPPNVIREKKIKGEHPNTDRLYKNNGDKTFTDVSKKAGILIEGYGLGINILDIDKDGWPDIHISNDFLSNDVIYQNNRDGTFSNKIDTYFRHQSYAAMGTDFGDINNDGLMDILALDMLPNENERVKRMYQSAGYDRFKSEIMAGYTRQYKRNTLQLNTGLSPNGTYSFSDISPLAGLESTDWSWSALFADYDNDGLQDVMITNGVPRNATDNDFSNYKMNLLRRYGFNRKTQDSLYKKIQDLDGSHVKNFLFKNNGDLTFSDSSKVWGFSQKSYSTGAAYTDFNNDGALDIIINNIDNPSFIYKNGLDSTSNNYFKIKLTGPKNNSQAIGSTISLYTDTTSIHRYYSVTRGYLSSMATPLHFGLGSIQNIDSLVIIWPDNSKKVVCNPTINKLLEVTYNPENNNKIDWDLKKKRKLDRPKFFSDVTKNKKINFFHKEQEYVDFKIQPLLPHKFSRLGPGIAVGDVNNDGRDDFFIGGAFEQSGEIFLQNKDGSFISSTLESGSNYEEDMGSLLMDFNKDGNLDLYVASGGSEFRANSKYYQDRLYVGDGTGKFNHKPNAIPQINSSTAAVTASDFDHDGIKELFVGGRVVPSQYPKAPESYILKWQNNKFTDITEKVAPGLNRIGMVTSATWTDYNNDSWVDLMILGEWMPITLFENRKGKLVDVTEKLGLSKTVGWWNSITTGDFNQDGYTDYVMGNLGLNSNLKNEHNGPVKIHYADFNNDGIIDPIISKIVNGKRYPIHLKDDVTRQIPSLKRRFPTYESYGEATLTDIFSQESLENAKEHAINTFKTSILMNNKGNSFEISPLPNEAQMAPIFGIQSADYDSDGYTDLLMIGNSFSTEVFNGWYDAFNGLLLKGNGKGIFEPTLFEESGFYFNKDSKALAKIAGVNNQNLILAAHNNGDLKAFQHDHKNAPNSQITAKEDEAWAEIYYKNGISEKIEFYAGGGYLSQSSKLIVLSKKVDYVVFYDQAGSSRKVTF